MWYTSNGFQTDRATYFGATSKYECEQSHKDNYNDLVWDNTIILFHSERLSSAHHIVPLLFPARGIHQGWPSDLVVIHLAPVFLLSLVFVFLWYNRYSSACTSCTSCTVDQILRICRPNAIELLLSTTVGFLMTWQLTQMQHNSVNVDVQQMSILKSWMQTSGCKLERAEYQWYCVMLFCKAGPLWLRQQYQWAWKLLVHKQKVKEWLHM